MCSVTYNQPQLIKKKKKKNRYLAGSSGSFHTYKNRPIVSMIDFPKIFYNISRFLTSILRLTLRDPSSRLRRGVSAERRITKNIEVANHDFSRGRDGTMRGEGEVG